MFSGAAGISDRDDVLGAASEFDEVGQGATAG
jgi:hypothetical protein